MQDSFMELEDSVQSQDNKVQDIIERILNNICYQQCYAWWLEHGKPVKCHNIYYSNHVKQADFDSGRTKRDEAERTLLSSHEAILLGIETDESNEAFYFSDLAEIVDGSV